MTDGEIISAILGRCFIIFDSLQERNEVLIMLRERGFNIGSILYNHARDELLVIYRGELGECIRVCEYAPSWVYNGSSCFPNRIYCYTPSNLCDELIDIEELLLIKDGGNGAV